MTQCQDTDAVSSPTSITPTDSIRADMPAGQQTDTSHIALELPCQQPDSADQPSGQCTAPTRTHRTELGRKTTGHGHHETGRQTWRRLFSRSATVSSKPGKQARREISPATVTKQRAASEPTGHRKHSSVVGSTSALPHPKPVDSLRLGVSVA